MNSKLIHKGKAAYYILAAVILFFAINVISSLALNRFNIDMTADNIYTLSNESKEILEKIEDPISIKLFYSNKTADGIPVLKAYAARVRGLLEEYISASNGNITFDIIEPEPFSPEEDEAVAFGIKGIDIDQIGTKVYFGLAASNAVDDIKTIPFMSFEDEQFLEYEITRMLYDLANPKRKKVGILSSIELGSAPLMGIPGLGGSPWLVVQKMAQTFDIEKIETTTNKIDNDIDVLMVVQPKDFLPETLYAIDQYVLGGGRAIFFIDPNKEGGGTGNPNDRAFDSDINKLLNIWGVRMSPYSVAADRNMARKYDKVANREESWKYVDYIAWLGLRADAINRDSVITSKLKVVNLNTAGIIEPLVGADMNIQPLLQTTKNAAKISASKVRNSPDVNELLRRFVTDNKNYILAANITGRAKTSFPKRSGSGHLDASQDKINVIVVADTDILRNETWADTRDVQGYKLVTMNADNANFVINALDYLSGAGELINIRSKSDLKRPFTKVEELKTLAEERYLKKEEELKNKLAMTEKRLEELKNMAEQQAGNRLSFKNQQQMEIKRFSDEMVSIRKELRNVQGELRKDIESLGATLKFINIWLMPLLVMILAGFILWRRNNAQNL